MIKSENINITLHVLIWGTVLLLPYLFVTTPQEHYGQIGPLQCNFFTLTNVAHIGLFYFNAFYLYSKFLTPKQWPAYLLCAALLIIGFYHVKVVILNTWFPELAADETAFQFTFFPIIIFLGISTVYRLVLDKINHEKEITRREAEQLSLELKFLRSQVSPHFLFNVLNNLVAMARYKSDHLEPSLIKLSELMRYMLYESDEKRVTIETELEYLKSYIELQKLRFEEDVEIRTDIRHEGNSLSIEPMLLIPFVENAFKHGAAVVQHPLIWIKLNVAGDTLSFEVKNKFEEINQSKDKDSGIGLSNLKARLNLLYPEQHQLSIKKGDGIFNVNLLLKLK